MKREPKPKEPKPLHMYVLVDGDTVSAHDETDAWKVWKESQDDRRSVATLERKFGKAIQMPDQERVRLTEYGRPRRRAWGVLAREVGRRFFASGTCD